jgi:DNA polymerase-3 subunit gamma/tau
LLQRIERIERRAGAVAASDASAAPTALSAPPAPPTASAPPATPASKQAAQRPPEKAAAPRKPPAAAAAPSPAPVKDAAPTPSNTSEPAPVEDAAPTPARSSDAALVEHAATPTADETVVPAVPSEPVPAGQLDSAALRRLWPEVLDIVKQSSRRTRALLDNAQIMTVDGQLVTLSAPTALAKMIAEDSNTALLRQALTQIVGGNWRIVVDGGAAAPADPGPTGAAAGPRPTARTVPADAEPDPRDDTEPDEPGTPAADPEAEALKLLKAELGARPLDSGP